MVDNRVGQVVHSRLDSQHGARFAAEFPVAGRGIANALQDQLPEQASHGREIICAGCGGDAEFNSQTLIGYFFAAIVEIVTLENAVLKLLPTLVAVAPEIFQCHAEEVANPLAVKVLFRRLLVRPDVLLPEFSFGSLEVERDKMLRASALRTGGSFV